MFIEFEDRKSTSPFVERIWRANSRTGGTFLSMAEGNIELVITKLPGFLAVTLRGPVSKGTQVECPADGEWLAIRFRLGTYLPRIATAALIDHQDVQLPVLANGRFWLGDLTWGIPDYENAEVSRWIDEARGETDNAKRMALYARIQSQIVADQPEIFGMVANRIWARRDYVQGFAFSPVRFTGEIDLYPLWARG